MDTRSLIALGMVLSVVVVAVLRGVMDGAMTKELLVIVSSGIVGSLVPRGLQRLQRHTDGPDLPPGPSGGQPKTAP